MTSHVRIAWEGARLRSCTRELVCMCACDRVSAWMRGQLNSRTSELLVSADSAACHLVT